MKKIKVKGNLYTQKVATIGKKTRNKVLLRNLGKDFELATLSIERYADTPKALNKKIKQVKSNLTDAEILINKELGVSKNSKDSSYRKKLLSFFEE